MYFKLLRLIFSRPTTQIFKDSSSCKLVMSLLYFQSSALGRDYQQILIIEPSGKVVSSLESDLARRMRGKERHRVPPEIKWSDAYQEKTLKIYCPWQKKHRSLLVQ